MKCEIHTKFAVIALFVLNGICIGDFTQSAHKYWMSNINLNVKRTNLTWIFRTKFMDYWKNHLLYSTWWTPEPLVSKIEICPYKWWMPSAWFQNNKLFVSCYAKKECVLTKQGSRRQANDGGCRAQEWNSIYIHTHNEINMIFHYIS